jgi:hypothetical protein
MEVAKNTHDHASSRRSIAAGAADNSKGVTGFLEADLNKLRVVNVRGISGSPSKRLSFLVTAAAATGNPGNQTLKDLTSAVSRNQKID